MMMVIYISVVLLIGAVIVGLYQWYMLRKESKES